MALKETIQRFTPMLYVRGSKDAVAFYDEVFGTEEIAERTMLLSQVPGMEAVPGADRTVVYSKLQFADGSGLNVAEQNEGGPTTREGVVVGNNIHVGLQHSDAAVQKAEFDKLAEGGEVLEPLEEKFWGVAFGIVRDKYGVIWESNCYLKQG
ncbi:VOC family protein [Streptomyces hesseae]|uniref:VOC family protein n=1 Tax=Streptomyces hesseae TaxID=3075519 RepID=A0ABU2SJR2_9ACTN|nr:VOC family protein [Streptomyces sp. DSM 40473]MDT0449211.1 VOC family protein [Streptomyces sp. DSM 40473]